MTATATHWSVAKDQCSAIAFANVKLDPLVLSEEGYVALIRAKDGPDSIPVLLDTDYAVWRLIYSILNPLEIVTKEGELRESFLKSKLIAHIKPFLEDAGKREREAKRYSLASQIATFSGINIEEALASIPE